MSIKCVSCYKTADEIDFTRKDKVFKTCNCCSIKFQLKHKSKSESADEDKKLYNALYYIKNKQKLLARSNAYRITHKTYHLCECGKMVFNTQNNKHIQSIYHNQHIINNKDRINDIKIKLS